MAPGLPSGIRNTEIRSWTDVCITIGNIKLYTASAVLASWSPVFELMLYGEGKWKEKEEKVIPMEHYAAEDIDELLSDLAPGHNLQVTGNNLAFLCNFAELYQVDWLRSACISFMIARKEASPQYLALAYRYNFLSVAKKVFAAMVFIEGPCDNWLPLPKYVTREEMPDSFFTCLIRVPYAQMEVCWARLEDVLDGCQEAVLSDTAHYRNDDTGETSFSLDALHCRHCDRVLLDTKYCTEEECISKMLRRAIAQLEEDWNTEQ